MAPKLKQDMGKQPITPPAQTEIPVQQVLPPDPLANKVHQIENLANQEEATSHLRGLLKTDLITRFEIGGVLQKFRKEGWFAPDKTFSELCEAQLGRSIRTAEYHIKLYNFLAESGLPMEVLNKLSWTHYRVLSERVEPADLSGWLEKAEGKTVAELREILVNKIPDQLDGDPNKTSVVTFKPHADQLETIKQAIALAKEISGTEYDTVAFEHICIEFLGTSSPMPSKGYAKSMIKKMMEILEFEKSVKFLHEVFPGSKIAASQPNK